MAPFETLCCAAVHEGDDGLVEFEHDDHADVHVIHDGTGAEFFDYVYDGQGRLVGFSSHISVKVHARGEFIHDLGTGVLVESATKNLLSAIQLRKAYTRVPTDEERIRYVHKLNGSSITFRLQEDGYYHTKLASTQGVTVSAVDFYNPPALKPVPSDKASECCKWRDYIGPPIMRVLPS